MADIASENARECITMTPNNTGTSYINIWCAVAASPQDGEKEQVSPAFSKYCRQRCLFGYLIFFSSY